MGRVLILTAVEFEARTLVRAFRLSPLPAAAPATLPANAPAPLPSWSNDKVMLTVVGLRARQLAATNLNLENIDGIIMLGLAGALSPDLHIADVIIDGDPPAIPLVVTRGSIHTASAIVATPEQKKSLFQKTRCLAVDMETQHARIFSTQYNKPFLAIRAISDTAHDPIHPAMLTLVDDYGTPRVGRALSMLAIKPWKIKPMLKLRHNSQLALAKLANVAREVVASGWPNHPLAPLHKSDPLSGSLNASSPH
jgi:hypothetical protein